MSKPRSKQPPQPADPGYTDQELQPTRTTCTYCGKPCTITNYEAHWAHAIYHAHCWPHANHWPQPHPTKR